MRLIKWLTTAASLLIASHSPALAEDLLLRDCQVVDPATQTVIHKDVLILNGRIAPDSAKYSKDKTKIIDVHGKWVIPALVDLHVHCAGNPLPDGKFEELSPHKTAKVMLYCGVCAYLDLGHNDEQEIFGARDEQRKTPDKFNDEADIYCAGRPIGRWSLHLASQAEAVVSRYQKKWNPDVIKIIYASNSLSHEAFKAVVDASRAHGLKTVVHIGPWENARDAIECGATAVTHFFDDKPISDDLVTLWSKSNTVSIPTMAVQCDMANFVRDHSLLQSPLLKSITSDDSIRAFYNTKIFVSDARVTLRWQNADIKNDEETFRKLASAGLEMLGGSDTNNQGTFQGFSLHRDIKIMQDCGYSPWQALAAGTTKAAKFLDRRPGHREGDIAELVILNADPTVDVANTQKIFAVIHRGVLLDRKAHF